MMVPARSWAPRWQRWALSGCVASAVLIGDGFVPGGTLGSALADEAAAQTPAAVPSILKPIDPELVKLLKDAGFSDPYAVIVLEPQDEITVLVPEVGNGEKQFGMPEDEEVHLPDPETNSAQPRDFEQLVVIRVASPAVVTVCEKISGTKVSAGRRNGRR